MRKLIPLTGGFFNKPLLLTIVSSNFLHGNAALADKRQVTRALSWGQR